MPQHQQLLVTGAGARGHQHWNTTTTITADSAAKATNLRPAKLPQVPTNERLSFAVDQFTGSRHPRTARDSSAVTSLCATVYRWAVTATGPFLGQPGPLALERPTQDWWWCRESRWCLRQGPLICHPQVQRCPSGHQYPQRASQQAVHALCAPSYQRVDRSAFSPATGQQTDAARY